MKELKLDLSWLSAAKVGDLVTTSRFEGEERIVRRITFIKKNALYGSGYAVEADGGEPCKCCGRTGRPAKSTVGVGIDGAWFEPYTGTEDKK